MYTIPKLIKQVGKWFHMIRKIFSPQQLETFYGRKSDKNTSTTKIVNPRLSSFQRLCVFDMLQCFVQQWISGRCVRCADYFPIRKAAAAKAGLLEGDSAAQSQLHKNAAA